MGNHCKGLCNFTPKINKTKTMSSFTVKSRIWIESSKGIYLGYGKIALLEKISETGSINSAAKELGLSYKKAWKLIESMNAQSTSPLVKTETGGKGGGGTVVTKAGLKAIKAFNKLDKKCKKALAKEFKKLNF
ncbi:Molybdenum-pterin-binding protein MopA [Flavobacteriales bacterium]|jgi:molybdate transport system regulatory protein|nr:hypothetical protein [Flavobacteriales bacterium]GIK69849.1 MAG: hypothetical protein BroJett020_11440 [Bacteroidota bacterium]CAG0993790.1 Molybdenum-pterin-binding protein MopA [Flavobacteriales bacterium]